MTSSAEKDAGRITPEGRARLDKYGSTLDAGNVRLLCERIADYPEVLAAAASVLAARGDLYVCPTTGETESRTMGGFDVCCDHPECPGNTRPLPPDRTE